MGDRSTGSSREVLSQALALELQDWKAGDGQDLPAVAAAGDFGLVFGAHGTVTPIINSEAGGAITDIMRRTLRMPVDYQGSANINKSAVLKVEVRVNNAGMTAADLACDVRVSDGQAGFRIAGNQVVAPQSVDVNSTTWVVQEFDLGKLLVAGDILDIEFTGTENDNASGGVIQIGRTFIEYNGRD